MKLHPELIMKYDPRSDRDRQLKLWVMGNNEVLGAYYFKNLQEAIEGFQIAWNVFGSTCDFYNSLSEKKIDGDE